MLQLRKLVLLAAVLAPWPARGAALTFDFFGTVTQVPVDDFSTGIQPGDTITGQFTFDSTAVDGIGSPSTGSYTSSGASFGMSVTIGAGALLFSESGLLNIGILDSFVDQYTVTATSDILTLELFFQDNTGNTFSSDALPLLPPSLAGFAQRDFHLDQTNISGDETQVDGTIASLTCSGCAASSIPEPSTLCLLFTGAILFGGLRRRSRRQFKKPGVTL